MCDGLGNSGLHKGFGVGSDGDAGVEDLGGCMFLREGHSCGGTNR